MLPPKTKQKIKPVIINEVANEIKTNLLNKAPGYNLITTKTLEELLKKVIKKLMFLIKASLRLTYNRKQQKLL